MACDCVLIGRLTKDAQAFASEADGHSYLRMTIASDRGYGQKKQTDFFLVTTNTANLSPYLLKGVKVAVIGQVVSWKTKEGEAERVHYKIMANRIELLESKGQPSPAPQRDTSPQGQEREVREVMAKTPDDFNDDNCPF